MLEIMSDANVRERILVHLGRLLHNFLASAVALDDQTTDHVTRFYRRIPLHTEFDRRRAQVLDAEPLCSVIRSLRNVALHQRLPTTRVGIQVRGPTGGRVNDPGTTERMTFHLDVVYALALIRTRIRDRDNPVDLQAMEYLAGLGEDFLLTELVTRFSRAFSPLAEWLRETEKQYEGAEMQKFRDKYNELVSRYNAALGS